MNYFNFQTQKHSPQVLAVLLLIIPYIPASNLLVTVGFVVAERVLYIPRLIYYIFKLLWLLVFSFVYCIYLILSYCIEKQYY